MEIQPRWKTVEMVKETIRRYDGQCSIYQAWKKLPKKMMYQAYKSAINYLKKNNEIIIDENNKISLIEHPRIQIGPIDKKKIIYNLSHYGYDLVSYEKIKKCDIIPIEDLIVEIVVRYPEARFIEAIPMLIIKNRINPFELYRKTYEFGIINKIGFLLKTSFIIAKKRKIDINYLRGLLKELDNKKEEKIGYLSSFQEDKKFLERTTPRLMKEWNLRGRFSIEDFFNEAYI